MSDQGTAAGPKFFVLGTYVQSVDMMDTWKARGINTVVQTPDGNNVLQWAQAADSKGLYQIRQPSSDLHFDINDPHLLAWAQQDEPSNTTSTLDYGKVAMDPSELQAEAAPWRAAAAAEGKFIPAWANHVGGHIYPDWAQNNALMHDYMAGGESDWLSSDSYPIEEHQAFVVKSNDGYTSTTQGITLDRQEAWSGGKPVMAFIGTSAYNDGNAVPTVGQFNAMAWSSVIHGASGITYFPVDLSPWDYDATPAELVTAMTSFDKQVSSISNILMNEKTGGRDPFTLYRSADQGVAPKSGQLPYPFEATEIKSDQGTYRIILNLSDKAQVLNMPDWGLNNVAFSAYQVKQGYGNGLSGQPTDPGTPTPPPADKGLLLHVSGDQYNGAPKFNVSVDGKVVATGLSATGDHSKGVWTDVKVAGDFSHASKVAVTFTNDSNGAGGDRNLYVDYITVAGHRYEGEAVGNHSHDAKAGELTSNGTMTFTTGAATPPGGTSFTGTAGNDSIVGNSSANTLLGYAGNDSLKGGDGNDTLNGGAGHDQLWGGAGNDKFVFGSPAEAKNDQVMDFAKGDVIDLSRIDANNGTSANDAFKLIGSQAFSAAGQIHIRQDAAHHLTYIEASTDSDHTPEFTIEVKGLHTFTAADFVL